MLFFPIPLCDIELLSNGYLQSANMWYNIFSRFDDSLPQRIAAETSEMTNYNEIFIPNTFPLNVIYYIFHICSF